MMGICDVANARTSRTSLKEAQSKPLPYCAREPIRIGLLLHLTA